MLATSLPQAIKAVKKCFVILPYDPRGHDVYDKYVCRACEQIGYEPERADDQLTDEILSGIESSLLGPDGLCLPG